MTPLFKDYLTFSKRERRGAFFLMAVIGLLLLAPYGLDVYHAKFKVKYDYSALDAEIETFLFTMHSNDSVNDSKKMAQPMVNFDVTPEYFYFDPNQTTAEDWERLGVKPKVVKTILNYTSKGGKFFKNEDLKKIYNMDDQTYNALVGYIKIPSKNKENQYLPPAKPDNQLERKEVKIVVFELNSVDSIELTEIKGIGQFFASKIIRYRDRLGGFLVKEQLLEIYEISPEKLSEIEGQIQVNPLLVKKININKCTIERLAKHPYLNWNIAKSIVRYRDNHGDFKNPAEIQNSDLVNDELYRKLAPYLSTE